MSREILFRGKKVGSKEWVEGSLVIAPSCYEIVTRDGESYEVDERSVGQYTGLKDNKGMKIFEGDVVDIENYYGENSKHAVINGYEFNYPAFDLLPDIDAGCNGLQWACEASTIFIIGNVYDHFPEFLIDKTNTNG